MSDININAEGALWWVFFVANATCCWFCYAPSLRRLWRRRPRGLVLARPGPGLRHRLVVLRTYGWPSPAAPEGKP